MKKVILFFALGLTVIGLRAQTPMPLPGGSFEQWETHPGYSVTVLFMPFSVYGSYTTPTGWSHLSYPVNESTSVYGMTVNINTSVPLVNASPDTAGAPDSAKAARLQTIMLSDIINPTVLSMAGDMIDSTLQQTVFPSILSIGELDLVASMPLLTSALGDMSNIEAMIPTLLTMDVNDYVSGGLPLDGFRPASLTGNYKYQSAASGDNGGIVLVGTHYNPVTHHRDIVGAGASLSLTDTPTYIPFTIEYTPLSDIIPGSSAEAPDSLIVLILSSASQNMQQGSMLWVDNLVLWSAPDTCAAITGINATAGIHDVTLTWSTTDPADAFELEYGQAGFVPGSGNSVTTTGTTYTLDGLAAATQYVVWIRTLCSDSIYGEWSTFSFTTAPDTCATVLDLAVAGDENNALLTWRGSSQPDHWEVEYGEQGFSHGNGTTIETTDTQLELTAIGLQPDTWYDFHVRAVCDVYGGWTSVQYHTPAPAVGIENTFGNSNQINLYPNPANGKCVVSLRDEAPAELHLYSLDGRLVTTVTTMGTPTTLQLPAQGIYLLQVLTPSGISTYKIINAVNADR